jgi:hypothetical protein
MSEERRQDFIKIAVLESMIEAQLVESILDTLNIPYRIQSFHDTAYDGLFQFQKGWGAIWAPLRHQKEILELLENLRSKE